MILLFLKAGPLDTTTLRRIPRWEGPLPRAGDWVTLTDGYGAETVKDVEWDFSCSPPTVKVWLK